MTGQLEAPPPHPAPPPPHTHTHAALHTHACPRAPPLSLHTKHSVNYLTLVSLSSSSLVLFFFFLPFLSYSERERRHRKGEKLPTRKRADPRRPRCAATRGSCEEENDTQWDSCRDAVHIGDFWPGFRKNGPCTRFATSQKRHLEGRFLEGFGEGGFLNDMRLKMLTLREKGAKRKYPF